MKVMRARVYFGLMLFGAAACGGGGASGGSNIAKTPGDSNNSAPPKVVVSSEIQNKFDQAIEAFVMHDKAGDWTDTICSDVASKFESASDDKLPEAYFNAGLAYQRCGNDKEAKTKFEKALSVEPKFHTARAQMALYRYKADGNESAAIDTLMKAIKDAQFQNVPALVAVAALQMQRDSSVGTEERCKDDMACAQLNLQRALAIDDGYMPASNQLGLLYYTQAKKRAGTLKSSLKGGSQIATNAATTKRASSQQLDLAALVCSQAIVRNPNYAPIHNTAGLISSELGLNTAVAEYKEAARLDPRLFEAQMNYGAANLSFRGFSQAQGAYERALKLRPNDYEAHLGLALALRGQIDDSNYDKQVSAVETELDAAKRIDPLRPDAYYNEGILVQEYKTKASGDQKGVVASFRKAQVIYRSFIEKAAGKIEYDGAVKKAKERIEDIDGTISFIESSPATTVAPNPKPTSFFPARESSGNLTSFYTSTLDGQGYLKPKLRPEDLSASLMHITYK